MAEAALAAIPEALRRHVKGVAIRVEEFPDEETEKEMELESPFDLLGLYRGVSLDRKSVSDPPQDVDMIFLYRRPLLDYWCETGEDLRRIVRHVLIHEIGHHFGLSDEEMERIEAET
ncbi:MAG: metallopeptidase family protein [Proteobacteria bacterium]|nr:metallopeptidase family protein [Pseudomonadota bacterium]